MTDAERQLLLNLEYGCDLYGGMYLAASELQMALSLSYKGFVQISSLPASLTWWCVTDAGREALGHIDLTKKSAVLKEPTIFVLHASFCPVTHAFAAKERGVCCCNFMERMAAAMAGDPIPAPERKEI